MTGYIDGERVGDSIAKYIERLQARIDLALERCDVILQDSNTHSDDIMYIQEALRKQP